MLLVLGINSSVINHLSPLSLPQKTTVAKLKIFHNNMLYSNLIDSKLEQPIHVTLQTDTTTVFSKSRFELKEFSASASVETFLITFKILLTSENFHLKV